MGTGDTASDSRREGAALWAPLNSLALWLLPLVWLLSCREVEGEHSPTSPAQAGLGTGEGPRPLSLPSPTPDLSCQGPGPSGLG